MREPRNLCHLKFLRDIKQEITSLLSDLIRINTTNPPGNETQAATYIAKYLSQGRVQN